MKFFRLAVRAVVLLTTGPALFAFTACTVSSVAILLTISGHTAPGPASPGPAPSLGSAPAIATGPAVRSAPAGGSAAAIASEPVDPASVSHSPARVRAGARLRASPRHRAGARLRAGAARRRPALIGTDGQGPRLPPSAFLARAARNLAVKINGQLARPLSEVGFDHGTLVLAYQIFQP